jgi:hypothetical protein
MRKRPERPAGAPGGATPDVFIGPRDVDALGG